VRPFNANWLKLVFDGASFRKPGLWSAVALGVLLLIVIIIARETLYHSVHFSERSLDNLRTAIISAAGAMLSATALTFTLAIFLTKQLGDLLHYLAFQQIYLHKRYLQYFTIILILAILQYCFGAILNQKNALAICALAMANLLTFAVVLVKALVQTSVLSDPEQIMKHRLEQAEKDMDDLVTAFDRDIKTLKPENGRFSRAQIPELVDYVVQTGHGIIDRSGLFIDEITPLIQQYEKRYDYEMIKKLLG
jgi:hypothetical protein